MIDSVAKMFGVVKEPKPVRKKRSSAKKSTHKHHKAHSKHK